jgi:hypothetical protein
MHFPVSTSTSHSAHEPPRVLPDITRVDVLWDRPIFRAPPLVIAPPLAKLEWFQPDPRESRVPLAS